MKRHKLFNSRNNALMNRLFENQGIKYKSLTEEEVTEGEMCPKCGKSPCVCEAEVNEEEITEEEVSEGIMAMHCPKCGTLNSKANNHCTNCGANLKGEEKVEEEKTEKHDDAPELKGDQKTELPDELQQAIIDKEKEDK